MLLKIYANCASLHAPAGSGYFSTACTNKRRGRDVHAGRTQEKHPRADLGSLTAMRYAIAGLRCVPQSMQGVHRVIQILFLFDVVSGHLKQLPCPYHKCFLCSRNAVWESGLVKLKERGLV